MIQEEIVRKLSWYKSDLKRLKGKVKEVELAILKLEEKKIEGEKDKSELWEKAREVIIERYIDDVDEVYWNLRHAKERGVV